MGSSALPVATRNSKAFNAQYRVNAFTREWDPVNAVRVEQIHGESYLNSGYVTADAIDGLGRLDNSNPDFILDKARGSSPQLTVQYLYAIEAGTDRRRRDEGGLRVVNIGPDGSLDDVAGFRSSKASIGSFCQRELYGAIERRGCHGVKELTALSLTTGADPTVSYALIRDALHRALADETDELWICTIGVAAHRKMSRKLGEFAFPQMGKPFYAHRDSDPRTSNDLLLVPVIAETRIFLDNIASGVEVAEDKAAIHLRAAALRFMADGLDYDFLTPFVRQTLSTYEKTNER